jgi:hypothetical protein
MRPAKCYPSGKGGGIMKDFFTRNSAGYGDIAEPLDQVSANLPYELQSKMFDQLATVGIAGAGLSVTLIGSLLRDASPVVWSTVVAFGLAAMTALGGNTRLIDSLRRRQPALKTAKAYTGMAMGLIGAGVGFLSMEVYYAGERTPIAANEVADLEKRGN